jgi:serine/threonine protein kinase
MTPKTMLMHGGRTRAADAVAALPSHVPAERPPFPADEELAELPPLPVEQTSAERPPIAVDMPTIRPLAAAEVPTIRPPQPLAAATPAVAAGRTASLPLPVATPTAATRDPNRGVNLSAPSSLVGRRIGNFVVERELGQGGFGAVYLARHVDADLALHHVIKVLHSELSHRPDMVERFRGEVRAAAALSHPGIVHVEDFGQLETGEQYIVMEHLVGTDLAAWLEQKGRLELPEALSLLEQAADALDAAHKRGIVHRDLKPSNLFRLADGRLKVLDFGIAKLMGDLANPGHQTLTGLVMGTPHYMAPEQAIFGMTKVTHLADVFALGVIAYELVTGTRPGSAPRSRSTCSRSTRVVPTRARCATSCPSHARTRSSRLSTRYRRSGRRRRVSLSGCYARAWSPAVAVAEPCTSRSRPEARSSSLLASSSGSRSAAKVTTPRRRLRPGRALASSRR